jgi:flagellar biosynthesis protein FliR
MPWLVELLTTHLLVFTLVLGRVGGMVFVAPLFSAIAVPAHVRAFIAIALAILLLPAQAASDVVAPASLFEWLLTVGMELLIGLALGVGATILIAGMQLAGQLMAQASGLSLAEVFDPGLDANVPVLSQFLGLFTLTVYLLIGGHRWLLAGLMNTFTTLPLGSCRLPASVPDALVTLLTESFSLGIKAAAPLVIALLLATLVLGLVGRTLPQLNILSVGIGPNAIIAFGMLAMLLGTIAWLFEDRLQPAIVVVLDALASSGPSDLELR